MTEPQFTIGGAMPADLLPHQGGIVLVETALTNKVPTSTTSLSSSSTATTTMSNFHDEMNRHGNVLSDHMSEGHADLNQTFWDMASGLLERRVYLSSLDPGLGKSTLLVHFIKELLRSGDHDEVAVLVCVSRLDEVDDFLGRLTDCTDHVGILTSDDELNAKAAVGPPEARVLLTTQQMLIQTCRRTGFKDADVFHYGGQPREVRV